jgi:hypothetical protein
MAGVVVQVVVPLKSSADDSVSLPVDDPPATSSCPFATMLFGSCVIEWPTRGEFIVPAADQVPLLKPGSKTMALASTVEPFLPPANRILPLVFVSVTAVCSSRGLEIDASVLNAFWTGSNRYTDEIVDVPLLPPTSSTWLLSWVLVVWISVAVWFLIPPGGTGPIVATQVPAPEAGL